MLYTEFVEGTGCKDTEKNYKVYKDLEIMYMNSNMSKDEIYEYGKKLVDNSKSEKELQIEKELKEQIKGIKEEIKSNNEIIKYHEEIAQYCKEVADNEMYKWNKRCIKNYKDANKLARRRIWECKWILGVA